MPEFNLIQRPDLVHRIQSFFGIRQAHITPSLAPNVVPVVVVANLDDVKGTKIVEGMPTSPQLMAGIIDQPAVAGQFSMGMLRNPAGSGVVLSVVYVGLSPTTSMRYGFLTQTANLATVIGAHDPAALPSSHWAADTRFKRQGLGVIPPKAVLSRGTQGVDPTATSGIWFGFDAALGFSTPVPTFGGLIRLQIDEGDALFFWHTVVNFRLYAQVWYEEQPKVIA